MGAPLTAASSWPGRPALPGRSRAAWVRPSWSTGDGSPGEEEAPAGQPGREQGDHFRHVEKPGQCPFQHVTKVKLPEPVRRSWPASPAPRSAPPPCVPRRPAACNCDGSSPGVARSSPVRGSGRRTSRTVGRRRSRWVGHSWGQTVSVLGTEQGEHLPESVRPCFKGEQSPTEARELGGTHGFRRTNGTGQARRSRPPP
jgi:hypothetical protein